MARTYLVNASTCLRRVRIYLADASMHLGGDSMNLRLARRCLKLARMNLIIARMNLIDNSLYHRGSSNNRINVKTQLLMANKNLHIAIDYLMKNCRHLRHYKYLLYLH